MELESSQLNQLTNLLDQNKRIAKNLVVLENSVKFIEAFFFDTYAFIEIFRGNKAYLKYTDKRIITTKLNLMELYRILIKEKNEKEAEKKFNEYSDACVIITDNIIKKAVKFKIKTDDKRVSYIDAIGYMIAMENGIKFLTGDEQFRDLPSVEFVK